MASPTSSLAHVSLVFYERGQFPESWDAFPEGTKSDGIQSLVSALLESPLFGTGPYLGPRYYEKDGLRVVPFLQKVHGERVFFWDKAAKKEDVSEPDKIIIRGTQFVEGKWVVYYSESDCPSFLYGILYEIFQTRVTIHPHPLPPIKRYDIVVGGPGLPSAVARPFPSP